MCVDINTDNLIKINYGQKVECEAHKIMCESVFIIQNMRKKYINSGGIAPFINQLSKSCAHCKMPMAVM